MYTTLKKAKTVIEPMNFLDFCEKNKDSIVKSLSEIASCIPKEMYENDNRMDIGKFVCHELSRDFDVLKEKLSRGYDMIYNDNKKISIKFNKINTFQSIGRNIGRTKPKNIIVKNFYNVRKGNKLNLNDFDYLWVIHYKVMPGDLFSKNPVCIVYGIATMNTIQNHLDEESRNDHQLKVRLNNDEWDYFSNYILEESIDSNESLNSYNYKIADELRWDLLRRVNKGKGE